MLFPFNLGDQFLDVIQTSSIFQAEFVSRCVIGLIFCRFLNRTQTGSQCLVHHTTEWGVKPSRDCSRSVQHVIINSQRRSH